MTELLHHGAPIARGARVTDFRGEAWEFVRVAQEPTPGKAGKVEVVPWGLPSYGPSDRATRFVTVFPHLTWAGADD